VSWRSRTSCRPIGVDVGARHIKAAQLAPAGGGWRVVAAATLPRSEVGGPVDVSDVQGLCRALSSGPFRGKDVALAVPAEKLMTGILELPPRTSGAPLEQIARAELSRMHNRLPASLEMNCWDLPAPARAKDATYVMAAGCVHEDADALLDAFEDAGLTVRRLEIHSVAVARACRPLLADVEGVASILDLGWTWARMVLLYRGVVVYQRNLSKGGLGQIAASLAEEHDLSSERVERLLAAAGLTGTGEGEDVETLERIRPGAQAYFDAMAEEMRMPLSYLANQYPDALAERLLLIGGASTIPGLRERVGEKLGIEARIVRPGDLTEAAGDLGKDLGPAFAVAVGLSQAAKG
jgi:type IV pilus assembly protein PilM